mmetsp:Transcript_1803/g.4506  ORF Transcript_1803/g.4506 Transcript_1803/m.4506 type:complete len:222 (-) Transcript_1803:1183-1848(-)
MEACIRHLPIVILLLALLRPILTKECSNTWMHTEVRDNREETFMDIPRNFIVGNSMIIDTIVLVLQVFMEIIMEARRRVIRRKSKILTNRGNCNTISNTRGTPTNQDRQGTIMAKDSSSGESTNIRGMIIHRLLHLGSIIEGGNSGKNSTRITSLVVQVSNLEGMETMFPLHSIHPDTTTGINTIIDYRAAMLPQAGSTVLKKMKIETYSPRQIFQGWEED